MQHQFKAISLLPKANHNGIKRVMQVIWRRYNRNTKRVVPSYERSLDRAETGVSEKVLEDSYAWISVCRFVVGGAVVCGDGVSMLDLIWLSAAPTARKGNTRAPIAPISNEVIRA